MKKYCLLLPFIFVVCFAPSAFATTTAIVSMQDSMTQSHHAVTHKKDITKEQEAGGKGGSAHSGPSEGAGDNVGLQNRTASTEQEANQEVSEYRQITSHGPMLTTDY